MLRKIKLYGELAKFVGHKEFEVKADTLAHAVSFLINNFEVGNYKKPFIIAEMSANHNGSLERALETIKVASECGVDALKMQTYTAETMTIDCDKLDFLIKGGLWDGYKLYDLYKRAETPFEWHDEIFKFARKIGITIFSTPFLPIITGTPA